MACSRCGRNETIEKHHIVPKSEGGSDDDKNKKELCLACHDYIHARRLLKSHLKVEKRRGDSDRIKVWEHRLEVLNKLNKPKLIRARGTYLSYWGDETTHDLPPRLPAKKLKEFSTQLSFEIKD